MQTGTGIGVDWTEEPEPPMWTNDDKIDVAVWIGIIALFLVGAWLILSSAKAQIATTAEIYQFSFTAQDVNVIEAGLNELPRKMSEPLIQKMQAQVQAMRAAKEEAARKAKEAADANPAEKKP